MSSNNLLAKSILCSIGVSVAMNIGLVDMVHANERQTDEQKPNNVAVTNEQNANVSAAQLAKLNEISAEIANINSRLNKLSQDLNQYQGKLSQQEIDDINNTLQRDDTQEEKVFDDIKKDKTFKEDTSTKQESTTKNTIPLASRNTFSSNFQDVPTANTSTVSNTTNTINTSNTTDTAKTPTSSDNTTNMVYTVATTNAVDDTNIENTANATDKANYNYDKYRYNVASQTVKPVQITYSDNYDNPSNNSIDDTDNKQNVAQSYRSNNKYSTAIEDTSDTSFKNIDFQDRKDDVLFDNNTSKNDKNAVELENNNQRKIDIQRNDKVKVSDGKDAIPLSSGLLMLDRYNTPAPDWTYDVFQRLENDGLLYPDKDIMDKKSLNRKEAAILTARSYNFYRIRSRQKQNSHTNNTSYERSNQSAFNDINTLMREFAVEVKSLGYDIIDSVSDTKVVYKGENDWKIGGEIRYNFARNGGSEKYRWWDNRLRARIYADKTLNKNWKLHALVESDRSHIYNKSKQAKPWKKDGRIELSRIYLEGNYKWWDIPFTIEAGKTYAYLADGNVLDSEFKGVKLAANPTPYEKYEIGVGKVNDDQSMHYGEYFLQARNWDYLGGYYHWNNYGTPTSIYAFGTDYHTGNYTLGAMYLASDKADGSGAKDGYVLSARYGKNFAWIPHTYEFDLKYYNMGGNTYINHTMSGLGGYMDGFSGWGAMAYYTLMENLVFSVQYYDLNDKTTDEKGKTLWTELSWSF